MFINTDCAVWNYRFKRMTSFFAHLSFECQFVICYLVSGVGLSLCTLLCISRWHQCQKCTFSWNKRMSSLRFDNVKVHLFLSLLYSLHLSNFLICSSSEMVNSGFLFVWVIERRRDKKWEISWMNGYRGYWSNCLCLWHVTIHFQKWAMNSIFWVTCKMTHSFSGLCVLFKQKSNQCAYAVGISTVFAIGILF